MMIGEDKRIFVDTNILIYSFFDKDVYYKLSKQKINTLFRKKYHFYISRQVIREFLVFVTRYNNENTVLKHTDFMNIVYRFLNQFVVLDEISDVTKILFELIENHKLSGKKNHDANIVATMKANNISKLLTHNVKDFERYTDVIEILPLEG